MIQDKKHKCGQCGEECKEVIRKVFTQDNGISVEKWVCNKCFYKQGRKVI